MDKKEATMNFFQFCEELKSDGCYIGEDGHVYRKDGRPLSRQCRNGYYILRRMYGHHTYHFMEHRVVWYLCNGEFDESLTINHKDFDRANNKIENLELLSQKENTIYSRDAGRLKPCRGEKGRNALFTDKEAQSIKWLKVNGWSTRQIENLFDAEHGNTVQRIISGARYGNVADATDIWAIYPAIVNRTWRKDLPKDQRINNAILGLVGEVGEFVDMQKKALYHGHERDVIHEMLELGDILYYITALCIEFDIDMAELMYENAQKLYARYPDGFTTENSLHRAEGDI